MKEEIARIIKHYAQNENSAMLKYYPNDINDIALQLHQAFIQAQIGMLQELKGEREWLRDAYSDRTCYAVETREFDKRIVHLTKLLEDE